MRTSAERARACAYQSNEMRSTIVLNIAVRLVTHLRVRAVVKLRERLHGLPQSSQTKSGTVTQNASRPASSYVVQFITY